MISQIPNRVRTGIVRLTHAQIAAHGYGNIPFLVPAAQEGEQLIALTPITKDPALQLTVGYQNGWYLAYYNAYGGAAGAGEFEVRWTFAK